jgi:hypothetical protein
MADCGASHLAREQGYLRTAGMRDIGRYCSSNKTSLFPLFSQRLSDLHCQDSRGCKFQKKKKKKGKGLEMNETPVGDRPVVAVECSMSCLESKSHGLRVKIVTPCTA